MRVRVKMKNQALRALSEAQKQALVMTAQQMVNQVRNERVIPFDTGNLQNESTFIDDSEVNNGTVSIVHDTPYARRLYFHPEFNFNTSKNANARGLWWDEWLHGGKVTEPFKLYRKFFRKCSGGYVK